jgi:geranylgeranyl diphosphate synthase type II
VTAVSVDDRYGFVKGVLEDYSSLAMETLREFLPDREPRRHLYDLLPLYPNRAGKGFRPGLCIASCRAHGGSSRNARRTAAALELLHNAFLVHDDVEDGSDYRRGGLTLHSEHGLGVAVNVGDAMNALSLRPLMANLTVVGPAVTLMIFTEIEHMIRQSVEGQAIELGWVRDNACDLSDADYLRMTLKKTCWYTCIHPCRLGALIATGDDSGLDRFNRFGYFMGAAFQIQDDLLNLVGDYAKYGKEIGGDIREGKRTLILIHTLKESTDRERDRFRSFLATPRAERSERDVAWVYRMMEKRHSFDYARQCARELAIAALDEFEVAFGDLPDSRDKRFLESIVLYMIERDL